MEHRFEIAYFKGFNTYTRFEVSDKKDAYQRALSLSDREESTQFDGIAIYDREERRWIARVEF